MPMAKAKFSGEKRDRYETEDAPDVVTVYRAKRQRGFAVGGTSPTHSAASVG